MRRAILTLGLAFLAALLARGAAAGDPPKAPGGASPSGKPSDKGSDPAASEPEYKGPEVRWALSLPDAIEEATQRNVLLYVHSHGST